MMKEGQQGVESSEQPSHHEIQQGQDQSDSAPEAKKYLKLKLIGLKLKYWYHFSLAVSDDMYYCFGDKIFA